MSTEIRKPNMTLEKTAMPLQEPLERIRNFQEVAFGYTKEMAMEEATRCMNCPARYCEQSCPVHNKVPDLMTKVREGDFAGAYELLGQTNPMPEICSRVCAQEKQCEMNCTRGIKGDSVAIGSVERFIADWAKKNNLKEVKKPNKQVNKKVAVVGAGPAGMACAESLAKKGCQVTVVEKETYIGGILYSGIPEFILPKQMLEDKVLELKELGVEFHTGKRVTSAEELLADGYDAIFLAVGAGKSVNMEVAGENLMGVYTVTKFLKAVNVEKEYENSNFSYKSPKNIAVIGGGNSAMDACRSAVRMGAEKVYLLYRRSEDEMPARKEEIIRSKEEGVEFVTLGAPVAFIDHGNGNLSGIECIRMELGEEEYPGGRRTVTAVKDSNFIIKADLAVLAIGYEVEPIIGVQMNEKGNVAVKYDGVTSTVDRIFAGGDVVTGANTVVHAISAGLKAADAIMDTFKNS